MPALRVKAVLENLPPTQDYVTDLAQKAGLPHKLIPKLSLVLEEVVVNIVSYAYPGGEGEMEIECALRPGEFCCTVRDWGPPFNPLEADMPDTHQPIEERPIGGLGLMLVTTMTNRREYVRNNGANELKFCMSY